MRLDRGELEGENPTPIYSGDRAGSALRLAQFKARVEDYKQFGAENDQEVLHRWQELSEGEKFDRIMDEIVGLNLGSDSRAYEVIAREVDMTRAGGPAAAIRAGSAGGMDRGGRA